MSLDPGRWYPIAALADCAPRHVYQTALGGTPLALWRDSAGAVNVWEDRCPHRGVRFSVGDVIGDALRCQYHAWRFASGSGQCTHIPAQPRLRPPATIRAQVWPHRIADGHVWSGIDPQGAPAPLGEGEVLRAIPIHRPAADVEPWLAEIAGARLRVQPLAEAHCVIRGVALAGASLAAIDARLEDLRRAVEAA